MTTQTRTFPGTTLRDLLVAKQIDAGADRITAEKRVKADEHYIKYMLAPNKRKKA